MARLQLEVVTPEKPILSQEVDDVVIPGLLGEFGVLPGHTTFLTELGTGRLVARKGSQIVEHQVSGGFCEVAGDRVVVLTDEA